MTWRVVERPVRDRLGEGLHWCARDGALWWTDILGHQIHRLLMESGRIDSWDAGDMIGWVIARRDQPGLLAGMRKGVFALNVEPFTVKPFAKLPDHPPENRMNDAAADAQGRIWAGTMAVVPGAPTGGLYRIDPGGSAMLVDRDYVIANGPAISPDGRWLYHTDSARRIVYRFAKHDDGSISARMPFIRFEGDMGHPDGMATDAEGGVWIAHWGGSRVSRFNPDGTLDRAIPLPASQITNVTFAGPRHDRMFVTSACDGLDISSEPHAGALFEVEADARGLATHLFAG